METLLLLVLVGLALLYLLRRQGSGDPGKSRSKPSARKKAEPAKTPYRATLIITGEEACEAVRALADKPFLDSDQNTPNLPLANCTATRCRCRYAHRDDRRETEEGPRRVESGMQEANYHTSGNAERRFGDRGRRHDD